MESTVANILKLKGFNGAKLIGGANGINNEVKNGFLMEVPDVFSYIEEKSLLVTTLYPIYKDEKAKDELIPKLASKNLSGICIKPQRYVPRIPEVMVEQANKLGFPLIKLPQGSNLSNLVNEILELSLNKHIGILKFRNFVNNKMMELFLKGEGLNTLIEEFSRIIDSPVILFDNDFNIKQTSENIKEKLVYLENKQLVNAENLQLVIDGTKIEQDNYIINRIKAGNNSFGYLMVVKCNREDESILVALNQASLLLASEFHKNRAILEKEKNYLNSFIREMLENNISSKTEAVNKAKSFGWELEFPQVIIDLKLLIQDEKIKRENYEKLIEEKTIENIISKEINIELRKIKLAHIDDSLVIFVNVGSFEYNKEILMNIAKIILNELKSMGKVGIGISKRIEKINELPLAYKEAKNGIEIGKTLNKDSFLIHYEDFRVINLIKEIKDIKLLKKYVNEKLGKLIEHDNTHDLSLMNTLKGVLDTNFNLQKTAKNMYIHYNTLRYRMEKLRELGINIDDGFEIGEIVLAYNIYIWFKSKGEM